MSKFGHLSYSGDLQYRFPKEYSTSHAVLVIKKCYVENGSQVFVTFMDCQIGFDKVCHNGIFLKLCKRSVPLLFY